MEAVSVQPIRDDRFASEIANPAVTSCRGHAGGRPHSSRGWPEGLSVRPCITATDANGLHVLFNQAGYQHSGTVLERFACSADVAHWIEGQGEGAHQIVGTMAATIVAFAGLYPMKGRQDHAGSICLGVHEEVQGRGYGTALLDLILATADRLIGLRRVQLTVFTDNARAIALYRTRGFAVEGRHVAFARRGDHYVDAFAMARIIAGA